MLSKHEETRYVVIVTDDDCSESYFVSSKTFGLCDSVQDAMKTSDLESAKALATATKEICSHLRGFYEEEGRVAIYKVTTTLLVDHGTGPVWSPTE